MSPDFKRLLERARSGRLVRVLLVYAIASWAVLQVIDVLDEQFGFPDWFFPAAIALLLIGLPIILGTALLQTRSGIDHGAREIELPDMPGPLAWYRVRRWLTWRRSILGGVLAFTGLMITSFGLVWWRTRGHELQPDVVAVLPFHTVGPDVDLWREGMVDVLSTAMDATGQFRSSDPRAVLNRWAKSHRDPDELPEPTEAADVAGPLGAGRMILGSVIRTGPESLRLAADLYSVRWLRKEGSATVEGPEDEVTGLVDRLTVELLKSAVGGEFPDLRVSAITTQSPAALRAYLQGEQAFRRARWDEAREALTRAIEIDSTFALALYRLGLAYGWSLSVYADELARYLDAANRHSAGLPRRDSVLILANARLYQGDLDAISLFERLSSLYPDDLEVWYGLGEAYFHMGTQRGVDRSRVLRPLERAFEIDSTFAPAIPHIIHVAHAQSDSALVGIWTRRYLELDSTSEHAHAVRVASALRYGAPEDSAEAHRALDNLPAGSVHELLCMCLSGIETLEYTEVTSFAALQNSRLPGSERSWVRQALSREYLRRGRVDDAVQQLESALALAPDIDDQMRFGLASAYAVGVARGSTYVDLVARLARSRSGPQDAAWRAILAAHQGRLQEARNLALTLERHADSLAAAGDSVGARTQTGLAWAVRGHLSAVAGEADSAVARFRRALDAISGYLLWQRDLQRYWLATLIEARGREEEAIEIYGMLYWTPWLEGPGYLRRARLHERRDERELAMRYYARFVELWGDADPGLQPQVRDARRALERLGGEVNHN